MQITRSHLAGILLLGSAALAACSIEAPPGLDLDAARRPFPVTVVEVSPPTADAGVGESVRFSVTLFDRRHKIVTDRPVAWSSSDTAVAAVDSTGVARTRAAGRATITATSEGVSGTAVLTVGGTPPPPPPPPDTTVVAVLLDPATVTLAPGDTQQFRARAVRRSGDTVALQGTFAATGGTIGASDGLYRAGAVSGTYHVIATDRSSGLADTSAVTIVEGPPPPPPPPPDTTAVVFVGAGDIGNCSTTTDEATARLLDGIAGTVFTAGDNAYSDGSATDFGSCYNPTWGRHRARTRPAPGNHDYNTSGAAGYFGYFGAAAGDPNKGYYSYDLGAWHLIALNSNVSMNANSAQEQWLRADLAASTKRCTLAYWHHPRFSSGSHGSSTASGPLWDALYAAGAEIVVVGHDHDYERFAPQTPNGSADAARGIREFVAGTGGTDLRSIGAGIPNSEVRNGDTHGVLKLTLRDGGYEWEFVPIAGRTFTDRGSGTCH